MKQKAALLAQNTAFQKTTVYVIIVCSIFIGIETLLKHWFWDIFFFYIDYLFVGFFLFEIIVRILAEPRIGEFFKLMRISKVDGKRQYELSEQGFWNWFDLILVAFSIISAAAHLFAHPDFIEVARLFRIFRIFRLLEVSDNLKVVERRIVSIIPTIFSFGLLLLVLIYIYATIGVYFFGEKKLENSDFNNLYGAILSMFQMMTLDGWSDVMNEVKNAFPNYPAFFVHLFFISFVVFTAIVTFNVFIAVMTSQVQERMQKDFEEKQQELKAVSKEIQESDDELQQSVNILLSEIKTLREEVASLKRQKR